MASLFRPFHHLFISFDPVNCHRCLQSSPTSFGHCHLMLFGNLIASVLILCFLFLAGISFFEGPRCQLLLNLCLIFNLTKKLVSGLLGPNILTQNQMKNRMNCCRRRFLVALNIYYQNQIGLLLIHLHLRISILQSSFLQHCLPSTVDYLCFRKMKFPAIMQLNILRQELFLLCPIDHLMRCLNYHSTQSITAGLSLN